MKNRYLSTRIMAIMMAAAMAVSAAPAAFAAERADSETIKEDNQPAADADSDTQEDADAQDSADADKTADAEGTKTEYPLTITTYDYDGNEIETTYEKAPEKVLAVYQGSIETMLALGLEDRLVATAGLDNEVPDELKDAFSKTNYLDEFTPSLETVTMLEPDMILSWSSLFSDKNLGNVTDWIDKGCNTYYNTNTRPDGDRTLENEFTDILNLGKIFDVQDKAQAIVDDAKAVIDKTLTATADVEEKPSVMVLDLKNDEDVADAIQDTILSCYENLKSLKQNRYFKTWMIRILINKCKDMIQKKKLVTYTDQMPETPFHEEKYAAMEWIQALEPLDSKYRLVVLLYYMEGFGIREISDILDMKESTVKSRLYRGRKQIAEMYGYKVKEGRA